ncbi:MAG: indole-3-glycerol phosphate synthase TrpC [Acidimicrobiales bacterium]
MTYLDRILAAHRQGAAADADSLDLAALEARAHQTAPTRGFRRALREAAQQQGLAVIAEVKRRSPSKGDLAIDLDPALLATQYASGGAAGLSVLTDQMFFGGSPGDLQAARAAVGLPVLRKDFTVSLADVFDARCMGADCLLLIVAALSEDELRRFHAAAVGVGLDVLVEIHDENELDRAMAVGATLVGVNQRDLVTFEVDTERAVRMAELIPEGVVKVAESGITGRPDALVLRDAGYQAVLVGESLVRSADPAVAVADLLP